MAKRMGLTGIPALCLRESCLIRGESAINDQTELDLYRNCKQDLRQTKRHHKHFGYITLVAGFTPRTKSESPGVNPGLLTLIRLLEAENGLAERFRSAARLGWQPNH